ncbi:MAG: histone deacetylase [Thermodesulfovibrio sp.]|nr:histone deacetylase [Thermodesulfovibrio sp.]
MKIIFHSKFKDVYASDPAAKAGRMEAILKELEGKYDFVEPEPATQQDLKRVHSQRHIDSIRKNPHLYEIACLSAGGAILASELAMKGQPSFALIRPPGHHASYDSSWGFCFFNNIAVALAKLKAENKIKKALILDIDLHFGDGTANIFAGTEIRYFHPEADKSEEFIELIESVLQKEIYDVLAVSAGFDRGVEDWGGQLSSEDYFTIGRLIKQSAEKICQGRRFAVLEGGYNHKVLGKNVKAFIDGLS